MARKNLNPTTEANVLVESRRRCCICFGLHRDIEVKTGQIAHLDKDNSNNDYDNLAFLCFYHHDQYDSKTSQSKNFTITEVKRYREELKNSFITIMRPVEISVDRKKLTPEEFKKEEIRKVLIEILNEYGPISSFISLAHKINQPTQTVENFLIDLVQDNIVRIDREIGSTKKTFSLVISNENLIIDAFKEQLGSEIIFDKRYLRKDLFEIDALIKTRTDNYMVEVISRRYFNSKIIDLIYKRIEKNRLAFNLDITVKKVLLIGLTEGNVKIDDSIIKLEDKGIIVKYIEIKK